MGLLGALDRLAVADARLAELEEKRARAQRFVPLGAGDPLPVLPATVTYSRADRDALARRWDLALPKYAGLLNARPGQGAPGQGAAGG